MENLVLQFGIPPLDKLIGRRGDSASATSPFGLHIDKGTSTSFCIVGPDGTGKSVLALHLASQYAAQTFGRSQNPPAVLYASTDLSLSKAQAIWPNFGLDLPAERDAELRYPASDTRSHTQSIQLQPYQPFADKGDEGSRAEPLSPSVTPPLRNYIVPADGVYSRNVAFIDLEAYTAGDDWGFLTRLLASLDRPGPGDERPLHFLVIDAIEGLQTMSGDRDAFGEQRSRRSRIAQMIRAAKDKCHLVLIVEEPRSDERFPEQFVTDVVVRLRSITGLDGYAHRTVEIEKARAQAHVRGQHSFTIRSGKGSTTGKQINPDDPPHWLQRNGVPYPLSYVQIYPSLDHQYREQMERRQTDLHLNPKSGVAEFGISYLDNLLARDTEGFRGVSYHSVTGIIGSSKTHKSRLARAFLSGCFRGLMTLMDFSTEGELKQTLKLVGQEHLRALETTDETQYEMWREEAQKIILSRYPAWARFMRRRSARSVAKHELAAAKNPAKVVDLEAARDRQVEAIRHAELDPGVAVLITTTDIHSHDLVRKCFEWLFRSKPIKHNDKHEAIMAFAESRTICRRLEVHSMTPAVLFNVIRRCVEEAQDILLGPEGHARRQSDGLSDEEFDRCAQIRLVIDNWDTIANTYPAIREDSMFLPYLLFYLRRQGVSTVIVESRTSGDALPAAAVSESALSHLVDNTILTWNVRFFGRRLVAISPLVTFSPGQRSLTREIVHAEEAIREDLDVVYVDPSLELFSHLASGEPEPVPLRVRLFTESESGATYAERMNTVMTDLFPAASRLGKRVVTWTALPFEENGALRYERLREMTYLHDESLDHTVVWQVDEFWSMDVGLARHSEYLNAVTFSGFQSTDDRLADPFKVFNPSVSEQRTKPGRSRRYEFFHVEELGYGPTLTETDRGPDRVPYTWDFGFLLMRAQAWRRAFGLSFKVGPDVGPNTSRKFAVEDIWNTLTAGSSRPIAQSGEATPRVQPWDWRVFLEACTLVAQANTHRTSEPTPAFDLALLTPESVSCLLLEIWMSEIVRVLSRGIHADGKPAKPHMRDPEAFLVSLGQERTLYPGGHSLKTLAETYRTELYKSLILMFEVLEPLGLVNQNRLFSFNIRNSHRDAVAVRHWYKTASITTLGYDPTNPLVPLQLPGHFSTRGDWFLSIASGSRSMRLGERAIDLLSSRRANIHRLQEGIGLPTRWLMEKEGYDMLRTCLYTDNPQFHSMPSQEPDGKSNGDGDGPTTDQQGRSKLIRPGFKRTTEGGLPQDWPVSRRTSLLYKDLCRLGASKAEFPEDGPFFWLWRSRLRQYDRHARILHKWLCRLMLVFEDIRRSRGPGWDSGFQVYDMLDQPNGAKRVEKYESYQEFLKLHELLLAEFDAATPYESPFKAED